MTVKQGPKAHTPLGSFVSFLPGALHDIVAQDVCDFNGMVDLHASVNGRAAVLLKVLASLLTGSEKDWEIIYSMLLGKCSFCRRRSAQTYYGRRLW